MRWSPPTQKTTYGFREPQEQVFRSQTGRGKPSTHSKRLKAKRKLGRR